MAKPVRFRDKWRIRWIADALSSESGTAEIWVPFQRTVEIGRAA